MKPKGQVNEELKGSWTQGTLTEDQAAERTLREISDRWGGGYRSRVKKAQVSACACLGKHRED